MKEQQKRNREKSTEGKDQARKEEEERLLTATASVGVLFTLSPTANCYISADTRKRRGKDKNKKPTIVCVKACNFLAGTAVQHVFQRSVLRFAHCHGLVPAHALQWLERGEFRVRPSTLRRAPRKPTYLANEHFHT